MKLFFRAAAASFLLSPVAVAVAAFDTLRKAESTSGEHVEEPTVTEESVIDVTLDLINDLKQDDASSGNRSNDEEFLNATFAPMEDSLVNATLDLINKLEKGDGSSGNESNDDDCSDHVEDLLNGDSNITVSNSTRLSDSEYIGLIECPGPCYNESGMVPEEPVMGYLIWSDMVQDVNYLVCNNMSEVHTFILCPNNHDATDFPPLAITHSNVQIKCGGLGNPEGCFVVGAEIHIAANLNGILLAGIEFISQRGEIHIGDDSHVTLDSCRFSDTLFSGNGDNMRAAVVSNGHLRANDCVFSGNLGQGAVLVAAKTAKFERSQFLNNRASEWTQCASAIQVGSYSHDDDSKGDSSVNTHNATNSTTTQAAIAAISIRNSCFDNNMGANIVRVEPGSSLSGNRKNAVLNAHGGALCPGIVVRSLNETTTTAMISAKCKIFAYRNTSCADFMSTAAPSPAPSSPAPTTSKPTKGPSRAASDKTEDDDQWAQDLIASLLQNETDDGFIPLSDNFDLQNTNSGAAAVINPTRSWSSLAAWVVASALVAALLQ